MTNTKDLGASLWAQTAIDAPDTTALNGSEKADVVVVGGGYTGLSAALHLAERGTDVVLVEAEEPGHGASGRNNGQVIPAYSRHNPDDAVAAFGTERGERLNDWVAGSADLVFELIRRHGIKCDAAQAGWLQPAHAESRLTGVRAKHDQWAARGADVALFDRAEAAELTGSPIYCGGWMHRRGGHIQPLGYARGLAYAAIGAGARLYSRSPAQAIDRADGRWQVKTPAGAVTAEHVILATNAYSGALWPKLRQSIVPVRSFHAASAPLGDNVVKTVLPGNRGLSDTRQALWAFRLDRDGRLVTTGAPLFTAGAVQAVGRTTVARLRTAFPQIDNPAVDYIWEGNIAMTVDRLPRFHVLAGGVAAGLGYSGRGIAMATAMGIQLADHANGTAVEDLALPPAPVKPLPMHGLVTPLSRALVLYYRWRDARA